MPLLRQSGSDFTSFVKAAAQYVPSGGAAAKPSKSGGVVVAKPGLGAVIRTSQVGALASPTTCAVVINGVTPPASSGGAAAGPFGPLSVSGCTLWFDAFDASYTRTGNTVTGWTNKSGNTSATTGVGTVSINQATLNGKSSVRFPSGTNYLNMGPITFSTRFRNYFIVGTMTNTLTYLVSGSQNIAGQATVGYYSDVELNGPGNGLVSANPSGVFGTPCILSICASTGNTGIWVNGTSQTITTNNITPTYFSTGTATNFYLGGDFYNSCAGNTDLYEVIQYDGIITTDNRQAIEGYLAWKWGLQSSLPPGHLYKSAAPV
jgi:hypothetical protein